MMIQFLDLSPEEYFELWQHTVTMEHSCEKEMLMSLLEGFSYMSHRRKEFPEAYNKHTNTHDTIPDQVMYKCLNQSIQSTSSSVIEMRSTLNSTGKSYWVYSYEIQTEGKWYTPTLKTENNRAYISEKHSSKTWWAGKAGYVEQYNISISLQYFIFPMRRHQLKEYTRLLLYKLAYNVEYHKNNSDMYFVFLKKKKTRLHWGTYNGSERAQLLVDLKA